MTKANVIQQLENARKAMVKAARAMQAEYGIDYIHNIELRSAAGMIRQWIKEIEEGV